MEIIKSISSLKKKQKKSIITIGIFDGVHHGHQRIIKDVNKKARRAGLKSHLVTFYPHPVDFFGNKKISLTTLDEKIALLDELGLEALSVIKFTKKFAQLLPGEFIRKYILPLHPHEIIVGSNHTFGKNASGNIELLKKFGKKYGFKVSIAKLKKKNKTNINSTLIRELILLGRIEKAEEFLGRKYSIFGKVVKGRGIGRKLGFPTANLKVSGNKLLPGPGVYLTKTLVKKKYYSSLTNIGFAPTFGKQNVLSVEVFLKDFKKNIYGTTLKVIFLKKIRDEKKFGSEEALKKQIKKDVSNLKEVKWR